MNPWEMLAEAIILQAVKDYRAILNDIDIPDVPTSRTKTLEECERFFCSEWFLVLSKTDGKTLMNRIKGEVNGSKNNSSNTKPHKDYFRNRIHML